VKVAFIGLGRMGQAMAQRVLAAGHDLVVWNRTSDRLGELVEQGAAVAGSIAEAAAPGAPVITMLANDDALAQVADGPGGLIANLPAGGIHIAMGTHRSDTIRRLTAAHAEAGQVLVAAPVLGRPTAVAAGQLGIIAAGPGDAIARAQPLFDAIGRRTFAGGSDPATASLLKLANNMVLACAIEVMGEAFSLVEKSGADPETLRDVLTEGLFSCPAYTGYSRAIIDRSWDAVGFTAALALKDVDLALATGAASGVPLPSAEVCRERLSRAIADGDAERDWIVMALAQARASGLA
jgi:3-hydroxyisobutyrate dehydrogenase-like beta-hydroxyacid dehydrogenase